MFGHIKIGVTRGVDHDLRIGQYIIHHHQRLGLVTDPPQPDCNIGMQGEGHDLR